VRLWLLLIAKRGADSRSRWPSQSVEGDAESVFRPLPADTWASEGGGERRWDAVMESRKNDSARTCQRSAASVGRGRRRLEISCECENRLSVRTAVSSRPRQRQTVRSIIRVLFAPQRPQTCLASWPPLYSQGLLHSRARAARGERQPAMASTLRHLRDGRGTCSQPAARTPLNIISGRLPKSTPEPLRRPLCTVCPRSAGSIDTFDGHFIWQCF
jgi:hypothetical protein